MVYMAVVSIQCVADGTGPNDGFWMNYLTNSSYIIGVSQDWIAGLFGDIIAIGI